MKLYYKGTNKEVQKGDILTDFRGNKAIAWYWREPTHGSGKITVKLNKEDYIGNEYYINVYDLEWR